MTESQLERHLSKYGRVGMHVDFLTLLQFYTFDDYSCIDCAARDRPSQVLCHGPV